MSPTKGTHYTHTPGQTRAAHRKTTALVRSRCQCNDNQCPLHTLSDICEHAATTIMYRLPIHQYWLDDVRTTSRKKIAGPYATRAEAKAVADKRGDRLYLVTSRVTLADETGTAVCDGCAEDMANSGLFADEDHLED